MRHLEWGLLGEVAAAGESLILVFGGRPGLPCLDALERSLARRVEVAPPVALVVQPEAMADADRAVGRLCQVGVICAVFTSLSEAISFGETMARLWCPAPRLLAAGAGEADGASVRTPFAVAMGR